MDNHVITYFGDGIPFAIGIVFGLKLETFI